ncbi:MAG: NHL repeat-containing protein [Polaromonas sp.]
MNIKRYLLIFVVPLTLMGALATRDAVGAGILYIGDGADNTIKRFDAETGTFLDADADPANDPDAFVRSASGGLNGPRGILFDGNLLVANQNVDLKIPGEILRFDGQTGAFQGALVPSTDKNTPFAPRGIILGANRNLYVADLTSAGRATGRLPTYDAAGNFLGDLDPKPFQNNDFHPRAVVFGPDGFLYVSVRDLKKDGLGGHVLRFKSDGSFDKVFIADNGGVGKLNRPEGLVFGPDGNLYITSFRANPGDTDSIRIYYSGSGDFKSKIDLYTPSQPRAFAQAILFGPNGCLFVPVNNTGEVRRYYTGIGSCDAPSPYHSFVAPGGTLKAPWYLTFGKTDPKTLEYRP